MINEDQNTSVQARDGNGRFVETIESLERDAQALRLRSMGYSLAEIDKHLGYGGPGNASRAISKAREKIMRPAVAEHVAVQLARLDYIALSLMEIKQRQHVVTSGGKIVTDDQGNPLRDAGPELACLRELRAVGESTRKMLGLDAAVKLELTQETAVDSSIRALVDAMDSQARAAEQAVKRGDS